MMMMSRMSTNTPPPMYMTAVAVPRVTRGSHPYPTRRASQTKLHVCDAGFADILLPQGEAGRRCEPRATRG